MTACAFWFEIAKVVVGIALAAIAGAITFRQYKVARAKFSLDLFDKREPVFQAVWAACSAYCFQVDAARALKAAEEMKNLAPRGRFLFGKEIYEYMLEARSKMNTLDTFHRRSERGTAETAETMRLVQDAETWLAHEADNGCKDRFGKYLDFSKWT